MQVHDIIEFSISDFSEELMLFRRLYEGGHSLRDISKITGVPASTIQKRLKTGGVTFRTNRSVRSTIVQRQKFKSSTPPPYGYCYLNGSLAKDAHEFPTLQMIAAQLTLGRTPTEIARFLNNRKLRTRTGKVWQQAHVYKIVQRLKSGGLHEL